MRGNYRNVLQSTSIFSAEFPPPQKKEKLLTVQENNPYSVTLKGLFLSHLTHPLPYKRLGPAAKTESTGFSTSSSAARRRILEILRTWRILAQRLRPARVSSSTSRDMSL